MHTLYCSKTKTLYPLFHSILDGRIQNQNEEVKCIPCTVLRQKRFTRCFKAFVSYTVISNISFTIIDVREMERAAQPSASSSVWQLEGIASLALLPSGSISGHFISQPCSKCFAIYGTQIACHRECSRGEDYRLIKLTVFDYSSKKEKDVMVECKGQDAARFQNVDHVHGWEEDVISMVAKSKEKNNELFISFECETLKAEKDAEDHINRFLPHLIGHEAVVNIGTMKIQGVNFNSDDNQTDMLEDRELDMGLSVTGSVITVKSDEDYKYEQLDCSVGSNMANVSNLSNLLGVCKQKSINTDEDMIRQMLAEELQAEGVTGNIPENKCQDSSLGWKIKKQVFNMN